METITKSQAMAADATALFRARNPLLWVRSREEQRIEKYLIEAAYGAGFTMVRTWDVAGGVCDVEGRSDRAFDGMGGDPDEVLKAISERRKERCVWIMRDLPVWLAPPVGAVTLRRLRNLARDLPTRPGPDAQAIVVISPSADVPAELTNHATVLDWPLPDRAEIAELLDATVESVSSKLDSKAVLNGSRDATIDAAVGLSGEEAQACFARSLVQLSKIDPVVVAAEKRRVVAREGVLEWFDPIPGGLKAVGGLDQYKTWLTSRALAFSPKAREYGLPAPKGCLVVGVPGCGKSLSAKAISTDWGVPLLRLDLGALRSKFVGESESNLRKALEVIEAIGRCVVWLDEIEKALAGATGEAGDGGVSADALGAILSWMQDRQGEAFVIATANNAEKLPPELLRKGRFDEVWWVDLPTPGERGAIAEAALRAHGRDAKALGINLQAIAEETDTFTGAEIAALVPDALFAAFSDDAREVTTDDLVEAARVVVPLAKTADDKIRRLREFWLGRARPATSPVVTGLRQGASSGVRSLDL